MEGSHRSFTHPERLSFVVPSRARPPCEGSTAPTSESLSRLQRFLHADIPACPSPTPVAGRLARAHLGCTLRTITRSIRLLHAIPWQTALTPFSARSTMMASVARSRSSRSLNSRRGGGRISVGMYLVNRQWSVRRTPITHAPGLSGNQIGYWTGTIQPSVRMKP